MAPDKTGTGKQPARVAQQNALVTRCLCASSSRPWHQSTYCSRRVGIKAHDLRSVNLRIRRELLSCSRCKGRPRAFLNLESGTFPAHAPQKLWLERGDGYRWGKDSRASSMMAPMVASGPAIRCSSRRNQSRTTSRRGVDLVGSPAAFLQRRGNQVILRPSRRGRRRREGSGVWRVGLPRSAAPALRAQTR
jgi:hypothetical protein